MVRKTWERRVKAILAVLLFTGGVTYWDFFVLSVIIKYTIQKF